MFVFLYNNFFYSQYFLYFYIDINLGGIFQIIIILECNLYNILFLECI